MSSPLTADPYIAAIQVRMTPRQGPPRAFSRSTSTIVPVFSATILPGSRGAHTVIGETGMLLMPEDGTCRDPRGRLLPLLPTDEPERRCLIRYLNAGADATTTAAAHSETDQIASHRGSAWEPCLGMLKARRSAERVMTRQPAPMMLPMVNLSVVFLPLR